MVILIIIIVYENKMSDVRFKKNGKVLLEILWKNVNENMFDSVLSTIVVKYDGKKL